MLEKASTAVNGLFRAILVTQEEKRVVEKASVFLENT